MAQLTPSQNNNIESIIKIIEEFLDIRFDHACRINNKITHVVEDLKWQQLMNLREVLGASKGIGENRYMTVDMMMGDDDNLRKTLYMAQGQNSICNEIIKSTDSRSAQAVSGLSIKDITSFYRAIDPSLVSILELVQTWIWWDIEDAAEIHFFDNETKKIGKLYSTQITPEIKHYYIRLFHRGDDEDVTKDEIITFEVAKLERVYQRWAERKSDQESYQMIIKRDEKESINIDDSIIKLSKHIANLKNIKTTHKLTEEMAKYYSQVFKCNQEEITMPKVLDYEQNTIDESKRNLSAIQATGKVYGQPYDYKEMKLKEYKVKLETVIKKLNIDTSKAIKITKIK